VDYEGDKNLPVGVQLLGPHFGEAKLLQIAKALETVES
jgi:Asp-tRNA(Asn)/Glu-tRNA(Gln) amidotransferase A subunit family amidase